MYASLGLFPPRLIRGEAMCWAPVMCAMITQRTATITFSTHMHNEALLSTYLGANFSASHAADKPFSSSLKHECMPGL